MALYQQLETLTLTGTKLHRKLANFLLRSYAEIDNLDLNTIAKLNDCSKASVIRLVQQLGYSGWNDFKLAYIAMQKTTSLNSTIDLNFPFAPTDPPHVLMKELVNIQSLVAKTLLEQSNDLAWQKLLNLFKDKHYFYCYVTSEYLDVAQHLQNYFARLGVQIIILNYDKLAMQKQYLDKADLVIAISYLDIAIDSRLIALLSELAQRTNLVLVSNLKEQNIKGEALQFTLDINENYYDKIASFASHQAFHLWVDFVYGLYFQMNYAKNYYLSHQLR